MTQERRPGRARRVVLVAVLAVAVLVLGGVIAVLVPILTHQSSGGSGQALPTGYVSESEAVGADGRTRVLSAESVDGGAVDLATLVPGDTVVVRGSGFDAGIGIYVAFCAIPAPGEKPMPCLGGAQTGDAAADPESLPSAWVTNDWAWRAFATHQYADADAGDFAVTLTVPDPVSDALDCRETACAIATRADHTAGSDRVQDMLLPVSFAD